jgi:hypothetical protein
VHIPAGLLCQPEEGHKQVQSEKIKETIIALQGIDMVITYDTNSKVDLAGSNFSAMLPPH